MGYNWSMRWEGGARRDRKSIQRDCTNINTEMGQILPAHPILGVSLAGVTSSICSRRNF